MAADPVPPSKRMPLQVATYVPANEETHKTVRNFLERRFWFAEEISVEDPEVEYLQPDVGVPREQFLRLVDERRTPIARLYTDTSSIVFVDRHGVIVIVEPIAEDDGMTRRLHVHFLRNGVATMHTIDGGVFLLDYVYNLADDSLWLEIGTNEMNMSETQWYHYEFNGAYAYKQNLDPVMRFCGYNKAKMPVFRIKDHSAPKLFVLGGKVCVFDNETEEAYETGELNFERTSLEVSQTPDISSLDVLRFERPTIRIYDRSRYVYRFPQRKEDGSYSLKTRDAITTLAAVRRRQAGKNSFPRYNEGVIVPKWILRESYWDYPGDDGST